jgi:hypothetical protein
MDGIHRQGRCFTVARGSIMSEPIELDDYREIWDTAKIEYRCCNYVAQAVFPYDAKTLECPKCRKMTKYLILDFPHYDREKP